MQIGKKVIWQKNIVKVQLQKIFTKQNNFA